MHVESQIAIAFPDPHSLQRFSLLSPGGVCGLYLELTSWQNVPMFKSISG